MKHMALILKGYGNLLRKGSLLIGTMLLVMGGTLILITPLWILATRYQTVYNTLILTVLGGGALFLLIIAPLRKALTQAGSLTLWIQLRLWPWLKRALLFIPLILALYGMVLLISAGLVWGAILLMLGLLYGGGYFYFVKKTGDKPR